MTLSQIHTFIVVSQTLNFTQAARELGVTQPAISTQIQLLEDEFQTKLFNRVGRRVYLSQTGILFLEQARQILEKVNQSTEAMMLFKPQSKVDPLRLGIGFGTGFGDDTAFLTYIRGTYKNQVVQTHQALDDELIQELDDQGVDMVLTQIPEETPRYEELVSRFDLNSIQKTNILVVAAPHVATGKWRRDPRILEEYPLILPSRHTFFRDYIESILARLSLKINVTLETSDTDLVRKVLLSGIGIGVLPALNVRNELDNGTLTGLSVPELSSSSVLGVLTRKGEASQIPSTLNLGIKILTSGWVTLSP
ncbi:MAG: LysR family transcriptional regulator [Leptospirales bacterium]